MSLRTKINTLVTENLYSNFERSVFHRLISKAVGTEIYLLNSLTYGLQLL